MARERPKLPKQTEENCILQAHADTLAMHASWQTMCEMPGSKQKQRYNDDDDDDHESRVRLLRLLFLLLLLLNLVQAYTACCTIAHGCKVLPVHAPARGGWDLAFGCWGLGFRFGHLSSVHDICKSTLQRGSSCSLEGERAATHGGDGPRNTQWDGGSGGCWWNSVPSNARAA